MPKTFQYINFADKTAREQAFPSPPGSIWWTALDLRNYTNDMALPQYPRLNTGIGERSRDSDWRGLNLEMKHVEAVIVSCSRQRANGIASGV